VPPKQRRLIALAGAPACGKSTLAGALVKALNQRRPGSGMGSGPGSAVVLGMDGYHYDDRVLQERGLRARKGAPSTFDVGGLHQMLLRLRHCRDVEIAIPVFDRSLEIARAGAAIVPPQASIVVVEGNYLLLDCPPWEDLARLFDVSLWLEVPESVLRRRLEARWRDQGLQPEAIACKIEQNDLPNARLACQRSRAADMVIRSG